jgi:DNA-binding CsgD family transcriptional regulator
VYRSYASVTGRGKDRFWQRAQANHGRSNKIVADHLFISEDPVKGHMKIIMAKLHASDRTHAVMIAIKRGFLIFGGMILSEGNGSCLSISQTTPRI